MQKEVREILEQLGEGKISVEDAESKLSQLRQKCGAKHSFIDSICSCLGNMDFIFDVGCSPHTLEEVHTGKLDSEVALNLCSRNGSIKVEAWEKEEFRLEVKKHVKASSLEAAEKLAAPYTFATITPTSIEAGDQNSRHNERGRISVSLHLWLPRSVKCHGQLKTANGSIRLDHISGSELDLSSTNGSLKVAAYAGSQLRAKTVNGSVRFDGTVSDLCCSTTNGSITATNRAAAGQVRCETVNGSIRAAVPGGEDTAISLEASTVSGRFKTSHSALDSVVGGRMKSISLRSDKWDSASNKIQLELRSVNGSIELVDAGAQPTASDSCGL